MEVIAVQANLVREYHFVIVFDRIGVAIDTFRGHPSQELLLVAILKRRRPRDAWAQLQYFPVLSDKSISIARDIGLCRER